MNLFDNFNPTPGSMALMNAGAGMMAAGGPSRHPVGFGQALNAGLNQGLNTYSQAQMDQLEQAKATLEANNRAVLEKTGYDLKSPELVQLLLKSGKVEAAIKTSQYQEAVNSGKEDEYLLFVSNEGKPYALGKKSGTATPWKTPEGQDFTALSERSPQGVYDRTIARTGAGVSKFTDSQGREGTGMNPDLVPGLRENLNDALKSNTQSESNAEIKPIWTSLAKAILPHLVQAESSNIPNAVSSKGAVGLGQLMPGTAKELGVNPNIPEENLRGSEQYLAKLLQQFNGDIAKATEAYNHGPNGDLSGNAYSNQVFNSQPADLSKWQRKELQGTGPSMQDKSAVELKTKQGEADIKTQQELDTVAGKAQVQANIDLPKVISETDYSIDLLKSLKDHPGLNDVVGVPNPLTSWTPGTKAAGFKTLLKQVGGKQFLQAFESLKGGGQITEVEGNKATEAIARLGTAQSEDDFKSAIDEFITVLDRGKKLAKEKAGIPLDEPKNRRSTDIISIPGNKIIRYDSNGNRVK